MPIDEVTDDELKEFLLAQPDTDEEASFEALREDPAKPWRLREALPPERFRKCLAPLKDMSKIDYDNAGYYQKGAVGGIIILLVGFGLNLDKSIASTTALKVIILLALSLFGVAALASRVARREEGEAIRQIYSDKHMHLTGCFDDQRALVALGMQNRTLDMFFAYTSAANKALAYAHYAILFAIILGLLGFMIALFGA
jgi:hypothetical protein